MLRVPYTPVIVIADSPTAAEFPTVSVKMAAEAAGLGVKLAVTPFGIPLAVRGTP